MIESLTYKVWVCSTRSWGCGLTIHLLFPAPNPKPKCPSVVHHFLQTTPFSDEISWTKFLYLILTHARNLKIYCYMYNVLPAGLKEFMEENIFKPAVSKNSLRSIQYRCDLNTKCMQLCNISGFLYSTHTHPSHPQIHSWHWVSFLFLYKFKIIKYTYSTWP